MAESDRHLDEEGLSKNIKDIIRMNYTFILKEVEVNGILDLLYEWHVLEDDDLQRIRIEQTDQSMARTFLAILSYKDKFANLKFLKALHGHQKHAWSTLMERKLEGKHQSLSETLREKETLDCFLLLCVRDCIQLKKQSKLSIGSIIKHFQEEVQKGGLQHEVTSHNVIQAILRVFPDVKIDEWQSQSRKGKKHKTNSNSEVAGVTWRKEQAEDPKTRLSGDYVSSAETAEKQIIQDSECTSQLFIDAWTTTDVCEWLKKLDIGQDIINAFHKQHVTGDVLRNITRDEIKEISPAASFGHQKRIIIARDQILEKKSMPKKINPESPEDVPKSTQKVADTARSFDMETSPTTVYRKGRYLPSPNKHSGDPLEVIQKYTLVPQEDIRSNNLLLSFQQQSAEFSCACINERNNGTLYFGVDAEGQIIGLTGEKSMWQKELTESIKNFFYPDESEKASKCIRPLRFVEVISGETQDKNLYVIEMDVVPAYNICTEDAFLIRKLVKKKGKDKFLGTRLMRIINDSIVEISGERDICSFMNIKHNLAEQRKQREKERLSVQGMNDNLRLKLRQLLCRGEETLDGDIFPILITSGMPCDDDNMKAQFQFMKDLPWKVVFDFDNGSGLFQYLEDHEEQVLKVLKVEDFDQSFEENQIDKDRLQNLLQDLKLSSHRPWIFTNGYEALDMPPLNVVKWKQERSEGFKEAVRFMKNEIPKGRAVIVFMLFSKDYDVMLEAADELATKFGNQWFTLAATKTISEQWQNGLYEKHLIEDKKELNQRSVIGMPWNHVNDTIYDILGTISEDTCELPTSKGAVVKLSNKMRNDWLDLEILGVRHCKNDEKPDQLSAHASQVEEQFYKGGEVDWWNFFFNDVLERSCLPDLLECVRCTLLGKTDQEDRVECINLYHQPGAGGTTTAKHILWKLKEQHRCAVVRKITNETCGQIIAFHSYEDLTPKPVLLLFDNLDEERISALRAELEEKAKQMTRHCSEISTIVTYVFLVCLTKTSLPLNQGSRYFKLNHELASDEQHWFRKKYLELEKKYEEKARIGVNPKHLISFNIMKENFNAEFIAKTVKDVLSEISNPQERILLKYVSLLNAYDLGFQTLPASAFNAVMEHQEISRFMHCGRWELHLSQALKILLCQVDKKNQNDGHHIRIFHNILSRNILDVLIKEQCDDHSANTSPTPLASAVSEFLDCGIFCMTYPDNSVDQLLKVVRDVVKRRAHNPQNGKPETKFAPLIEDIISESKQSVDGAADLLEKIYTLSDDVFVGQQLARLFIHAKNWKKAQHFAKQITDKKTANSYLWDTYGHAYKEQIKEKYQECIQNATGMTQPDAVEILDLAFDAIHIFQKEQEVSEQERTTYANNAGYFQELQVVVILLDCLSITNGLSEGNMLHRVLVHEIAMPQSISTMFGNDRVRRLLHIQNGATKAMARLEDEHLQLRDDMADEYRKSTLRRGMDTLIKYKESLENHYGEESDVVPKNLSIEEACKYRRRRIFRLAGNTFRAVFELRREEAGKHTLLKMRDMIQHNMDAEGENIFDLQMLLSVNLTLCCIDKKYKNEITREMMAEMAHTLYQSRDKLMDLNLEPFLFAAMFNWPYQASVIRQPIPAQEIPDILKNWRIAYYKKYPRQRDEGRPYRKKETTMFFLGNGNGMEGFAFDQELKAHGIKRNNVYFWRMSHVLERLERWMGTLINDGSDVRISFTQVGNKMSLNLPTSFPITNRGWWSKKVYCVIGFTWAGPKAFDISLEDPRKRVESQFQHSIVHRNSRQQSRPREEEKRRWLAYNHPDFLAEFNKTKDQLAYIEKLTAIPPKKRTKQQQSLCSNEWKLRLQLEKLQQFINDRLRVYSEFYTNY